MKKMLYALAAVALAGSVVSCGGSRSDSSSEETEMQNGRLTEALKSHDISTVSELADSMSLYVDDLTPSETVTVLMAFLEVHNSAIANGNKQADLETLRKYVDVYDIAVSANPAEMHAAFERARNINAELDFEQAFRDFRRALAEYDALQTYGEESEPEKAAADSTAADSTSTVVTTSIRTLD